MNEIVLALGSNLGERMHLLERAIILLKEVINNPSFSAIYETEALLPEAAPKSWNKPYLNMLIKGTTNLEPVKLLAKIKKIETQLGRISTEKWGPRTMDIDILAYGKQHIEEADLIIPHQQLLKRDFWVIPFAELWPEWKYMVVGEFCNQTIVTIRNKLYAKDDLKNYEQKT